MNASRKRYLRVSILGRRPQLFGGQSDRRASDISGPAQPSPPARNPHSAVSARPRALRPRTRRRQRCAANRCRRAQPPTATRRNNRRVQRGRDFRAGSGRSGVEGDRAQLGGCRVRCEVVGKGNRHRQKRCREHATGNRTDVGYHSKGQSKNVDRASPGRAGAARSVISTRASTRSRRNATGG